MDGCANENGCENVYNSRWDGVSFYHFPQKYFLLIINTIISLKGNPIFSKLKAKKKFQSVIMSLISSSWH